MRRDSSKSAKYLEAIAPAVDRLRGWTARRRVALLAVLGPLLMIGGCSNGTRLSFLAAQGPIADAERTHFLEVVAILGVFVALPIFILTPWLLWRYRYGATSSRYTPKWKAFLPLEIMTWAGPIVIVIVLGFLLWHSAHALDPYRPIASDTPALRVQAIGYDWKWLFIYPDLGIASVGRLPMPVNRPVAMKLTSATVMQSLQIPALVGQIYAMGGMVTQLHFAATRPGRFLGENTMYNGNGFHQQKFTAVAMTPDEFKAWVGKVRATGVALDARAYRVLSQRSTRAELAAALPQAKADDGGIYLTRVPPALFHHVVKATLSGTRIRLGQTWVPAAATARRIAKEP